MVFNNYFISLVTEENSSYFLSLVLSALVVIISIIPLAYARYGNGFKLQYLNSPRTLYKYLPAWGKRATWAHKNSFESFALHSPALLILIILSLYKVYLPTRVVDFVLLYPVFRVIYLFAYLADYAFLRALTWGGGMFCTILIYFYIVKILII